MKQIDEFTFQLFLIFIGFLLGNAHTAENCVGFVCKSGECVNGSLSCDGVRDCADGSDEAHCVECSAGSFLCANGACILRLWRCDGENDCGDFSDEANCGGNCPADKFHCADHSKCIETSWYCDGFVDCNDGSDEVAGCARKLEPCLNFTCRSNYECISESRVCDGSVDCLDGSDELNCTAPVTCLEKDLKFWCEDSTVCLGSELVCNGLRNCHDGSDEGGQCVTKTCSHAGCAHGCFQTPKKAVCYCKPGFKLHDGKHCKDVNECDYEFACSHVCSNTEGSYKCSCFDGYTLDSSRRSCLAEGPEPLLIYTTTKALKVVTLRSGYSHPIIENLDHAVGVDYDSIEQRIYWAEIDDHKEAVKSSKLDGKDNKYILTEGIVVVEDIAVDWIGRNLYLSDSALSRIIVCNTAGTSCAILFADMSQPRALALEPRDGLLFWTTWGRTPSIEKSGLDGSDPKVIISKNVVWPNGLTLDHEFRRIYWCDAGSRRIEETDFNGGNRKVVIEGLMQHPFSLAMFEDKFYWTDWARHSVESCNKNGSGHTFMIQENGDNIPMGVHVYHPVIQKIGNNPCWGTKCTDLCLLSPGGNFKCACSVGSRLHADGRTCVRESEPEILISLQNKIYTFQPAIIGINSANDTLVTAKSPITAITRDSATGTIYFAERDSHGIFAAKLGEVPKKIVEFHTSHVESLGVDYVGRNLYWIDSGTLTIELATLTGEHRMILVERLPQKPTSLALAPNTGLMFFGVVGKTSSIERMNMDGSDRVLLLDSDIGVPASLTVDAKRGHLYWVDTTEKKVERVTLDGKLRHTVHHDAGQPSSIALGLQSIFWADTQLNHLYWVNYKEPTTLHSLPFDIQGDSVTTAPLLRMASYASYIPDVPNYCDEQKCSHLCLMRSQTSRSCACPTGLKLKDGVTCGSESKCADDEFSCGDGKCISTGWTCDKIPDCIDKSDELNCVRNCQTGEFSCGNGQCIPKHLVCDRRKDCLNGLDEENCTLQECEPGFFRCGNARCINETWRCDGEPDCLDLSDETGCPNKSCEPGQFKCDSSTCIDSTWRCDGFPDCGDASDEQGCAPIHTQLCKAEEFRCSNGLCVDLEFKCDQRDDCGDGSDEAGCDYPVIPCPKSLFTCKSGACISEKSVCDNIMDCQGGEDEMNCPSSSCKRGEFLCDSQTCIPEAWLCDGDRDCTDGSDEKLPQCHQAVPTVTPDSKGNARNFFTHHVGYINTGMDKTTDAYQGRRGHCRADSYECRNGECVLAKEVCDGLVHCADGSDEGKPCSTACAENGGCRDFCIPHPDGPICQCRPGYFLAPDQKNCIDVDECVNNEECDHVCVNSPGTFACSCTKGYKLAPNHKTCKATGNPAFILAAFPNMITWMPMNFSGVHAFHQSKSSNINYLDFDAHAEEIYWMDTANGAIVKRALASKKLTVVVDGLRAPTPIAVDWVVGNVFFWDVDGEMMVCSLTVKFHCAPAFYAGQDAVDSMVLDAQIGKLFWSVWSKSVESGGGRIVTAWVNGRHRKVLVTEKVINPTGLSLDFVKERLYWSDAHLHTIESVKWDGSDRRVIHPTDHVHPMDMANFEDKLYWADGHFSAIFQCDKRSCSARNKIAEHLVKVKSLKIFHVVQQPTKGYNVCLEKKRCSDICLTVPLGFACRCPFGVPFVDKFNTTCNKTDRYGVGRSSCGLVCLNGGVCVPRGLVDICRCAPGFNGKSCEKISHYKTPTHWGTDGAGNYSWVAGLVIAILFVVLVMFAVYWYFRRFNGEKWRGSMAAIPFTNPLFEDQSDEDDEGEQDVESRGSPRLEKSYRSYSNPMFDKDCNANSPGLKVEFCVDSSTVSLIPESSPSKIGCSLPM